MQRANVFSCLVSGESGLGKKRANVVTLNVPTLLHPADILACWADIGKAERLLACIDRARELIGYEPSMPFEVGLDNTIQWFRNHWDLIEASARFGPGVLSAVREVTVTEDRETVAILAQARAEGNNTEP